MSEEQKVVDNQQNDMIQYVMISLSDGRQGVFVGPVLLSSSEMKLVPPKITNVNFSEPRAKPQPIINTEALSNESNNKV